MEQIKQCVDSTYHPDKPEDKYIELFQSYMPKKEMKYLSKAAE